MPHHDYNKYDTDEPVVTDLRLAVLGTCVGACLIFAITLFIDVEAHRGLINLPTWVSIGNVDDARVILSAIIGAVSTVLGLVFSVVLLVLSMAATQFGPRLLRRFILDQNGQGTIGLFTATFLFSLLTLVVVRYEGNHEFVPQLTTLTAVFLMMASFAALISYSQGIRKAIQTGNLIAKVDDDLTRTISDYIALRKAREKEFKHIKAENPGMLRQRCIDEGFAVRADNAGYLQSINYGKLINAAQKSDAIIALKIRPGQFVISGTVLGYVLIPSPNDNLDKKINHALSLGPNRTITQDPEFAIAQIVEIGCRALSSAINDPYTGIACVDWLCNSILSLVDLPDAGEAWFDEAGQTRLIELPVKFPRLVDASFDMIRQSGADQVAILIRILQNFIRMAPYFKTLEQRTAIMRQVVAIRELAELQSFTQTDLRDIMVLYRQLVEMLKI